MKKTLLTLFILASTVLVLNAQDKGEKKVQATEVIETPEIVFEKELHDYGTIDQGANGNYEFKFSNTGKEPLIITNCKGSCGCTVPSWPKEPIKPGGTGAIKVTYDTKRVGAFSKTVTISSNAKSNSKVISIKGVVNAKAEEETFPGKKAGFGVPLEGH